MRIAAPVLCLLLCLAAAAQQRKPAPAKSPPKPAPAEAATVFPITDLRVLGSGLYAHEKLVELTGLKIGEPGGKEIFQAARDRLVDSGFFASVAYQFGPDAGKPGYAVTFEVADIEQVYPVRFDRLPAGDAELRAALAKALPLFGERIPGTREIIERCRVAIEETLAAKGVAEAVRGRLTSDRVDDLYILFHPAAAPPVVAEIAFLGSSVIPAHALQKAIHGVAVGVEFRESRFREILDMSIRPLYEARGRLRVAFPKIETEPSQSIAGLKVTVEVSEGESYSLRQVRVEGASALNQELVRAADLKTDDVANFDDVRAAQERVQAAMRRNGFMRVASKIARSIDDERKSVDVTIEVEPGPEFRFGKLIVQGLDIHGEHEIKRIWGLDPGKRFNSEYPDFFLARVREDRIFEELGKTQAIVQPNDDLSVDVTLVFSKPEPPKVPAAPGRRPQ